MKTEEKSYLESKIFLLEPQDPKLDLGVVHRGSNIPEIGFKQAQRILRFWRILDKKCGEI